MGYKRIHENTRAYKRIQENTLEYNTMTVKFHIYFNTFQYMSIDLIYLIVFLCDLHIFLYTSLTFISICWALYRWCLSAAVSVLQGACLLRAGLGACFFLL